MLPDLSSAHTAQTADSDSLLAAADAAARALPPAFPLRATVAVNPFLGQVGEPLAMAAARLGRVAGQRVVPERASFAHKLASGDLRDEDLLAALAASPAAPKPADVASLKRALAEPGKAAVALPTVAGLAAGASGTDWPGLVERTFGAWAGGYFDQGQAHWTPAPGPSAFAAWREWATHDLTPEIAGLKGFCAHVAACPDTAERAILRATARLGLTAEAAETAFHRLFMDLGGWAQHARWLLWEAELAGGSDATLTDLLAVRLVWEEALLAHHDAAIADDWQATVAAHAAPLVPSADQVIDAILQESAERAHQRRLAEALDGPRAPVAGRPALQAAFCIDVRSEVFRRALEGAGNGIETLGFAGFFGLPVAHRGMGSDVVEKHLPVLLSPAMHSHAPASASVVEATRIQARAWRAWGRFRQAAVSSFAFVEAAGIGYAGKLVKDGLGLGGTDGTGEAAPQFDTPLDPAAKAELAAGILGAMALSKVRARLVLLVGHGATVANNPHDSAYQCGACGGYSGAVSSRLLAGLLNDPGVRAALPGLGVEVPEDTLFVAGLHDTTTDVVTLYPDTAAPDHAGDLAQAQAWLAQAGLVARAERAARLPGATAASVPARALNWAEVRPEWGLAGCAAFVAAPRAVTRGADLSGRSFLQSYDWRADPGFAVLELTLTAPVVVASWISLQYYGSCVAPDSFGSGNKLIHNVTGGIGVVEGNGGRLRAGLPWQAVHDGVRLAHDPLRLTVLIEAPQEAMSEVLARHPSVQALFDNGWLHLLALEEGRIAARYRPGRRWDPVQAAAAVAA